MNRRPKAARLFTVVFGSAGRYALLCGCVLLLTCTAASAVSNAAAQASNAARVAGRTTNASPGDASSTRFLLQTGNGGSGTNLSPQMQPNADGNTLPLIGFVATNPSTGGGSPARQPRSGALGVDGSTGTGGTAGSPGTNNAPGDNGPSGGPAGTLSTSLPVPEGQTPTPPPTGASPGTQPPTSRDGQAPLPIDAVPPPAFSKQSPPPPPTSGAPSPQLPPGVPAGPPLADQQAPSSSPTATDAPSQTPLTPTAGAPYEATARPSPRGNPTRPLTGSPLDGGFGAAAPPVGTVGTDGQGQGPNGAGSPESGKDGVGNGVFGPDAAAPARGQGGGTGTTAPNLSPNAATPKGSPSNPARPGGQPTQPTKSPMPTGTRASASSPSSSDQLAQFPNGAASPSGMGVSAGGRPSRPTANGPQLTGSEAAAPGGAPNVRPTSVLGAKPGLPPQAVLDIGPAAAAPEGSRRGALASKTNNNSTLGMTCTMYGQGLLPWNKSRNAFQQALTDFLKESYDNFSFDQAVYVGSVGIAGTKAARRRALLATPPDDQVTVYYDIEGVTDTSVAAKDLADATSGDKFRKLLQDKGLDVNRLEIVSTKQGGIGNIPLVIPVVNGDAASHVGAIAGAVIGGFVMLLLIAIVSVLCVRHKRNRNTSNNTPHGTYQGGPFAKQCSDPIKDPVGSPTGYIRPVARYVVASDRVSASDSAMTETPSESRSSTYTNHSSTAALAGHPHTWSHLKDSALGGGGYDGTRPSEEYGAWPTSTPRPLLGASPQLATQNLHPPNGQPRMVLGDQSTQSFDAFARSVSQQNPQPPQH